MLLLRFRHSRDDHYAARFESLYLILYSSNNLFPRILIYFIFSGFRFVASNGIKLWILGLLTMREGWRQEDKRQSTHCFYLLSRLEIAGYKV